MLVWFNLFSSIFRIDSKLFQHIQNVLFYVNIGIPDINAPNLLSILRFIFPEPIMLTNLINCVSLFRICVQTLMKQILSQRSHKIRNFKFSCKNLLIELGGVWIFKRKVSTNHSVENNPGTPNVNTRRLIFLSCNHFWGGIAWGPTSCF